MMINQAENIRTVEAVLFCFVATKENVALACPGGRHAALFVWWVGFTARCLGAQGLEIISFAVF